MDINIYSDYEIKMSSKGSQKVGHDEFQNYEDEKTLVVNGGQFFDALAITLSSNYVSSLYIDTKNNEIKVDVFDPMTGEAEQTTYEIKLVSIKE